MRLATGHRLAPSSAIRDAFVRLRAQPCPFLLETAWALDATQRWTLCGADPFAVMTARGRDIEVWIEGRAERTTGDPFAMLAALLERWRVPAGEDVPCVPLAAGYLGYDLGALLERVPQRARDDQGFPDLWLGFYDRVLVHDRLTDRVHELEAGPRRRRALDAAQYAAHLAPPAPAAGPNFTREKYLAAVASVKAAIAAGDVYQVNLTQRFAAPWPGDAFALYERLCELSPAPHAAYLEFGNRAVISSSPEEFLSIAAGRVRTRPIKGTRPRGGTDAQDRRLGDELWQSPKDDAELTMIVDLERNDLGRVATAGGVRVLVPKALEAHPTVWHLSSTIEAELAPGAGVVDVLRATFPGGSITGAPKIRAMQLIDELEPTRRAAYTGAIGYIGLDGRAELAVAIRTLLVAGRHVTFQTGGAITWDSDPAAEYEETLVKAQAMARALGLELPR